MKIFRNNQGFSMVEILVAASMLGMLALAGSKLMQNQTSAMKTIEVRGEYTTLLGDIRTILADSASCRATLGGRNAKSSANIPAILQAIPSGGNVTRYTANANWRNGTAYGNGKIRIVRMDLSDASTEVETTAGPAGTTGTTNLVVTFFIGLHPESKQEQFVTRNIALNVSPNTGTTIINDCSSSVADNSLNDMIKACLALSGTAAGAGYDPTTERCNLLNYPQAANTSFAVSTRYLNDWLAGVLDPRYVNTTGDTMTGALQINSNLGVTGTTTLGGTLTVAGASTLNNTLTVAGAAQFNSNKTVAGVSTHNGQTNLNGPVYLNNIMYVTGGNYIEFSSDRRKKKEIKSLKNVLSRINSLRPTQYKWKETNAPHMGLIAQELALVFPDLVSEVPDGSLAVDYIQMIPILIRGVQELSDENKKLKSELDLLKTELCSENKHYKFCKR